MKTSFSHHVCSWIPFVTIFRHRIWVDSFYNSERAFRTKPASFHMCILCAIKYHMVFRLWCCCYKPAAYTYTDRKLHQSWKTKRRQGMEWIKKRLTTNWWTCICGYNVEPQAGLEFGLMFWCGVINVWFSFNFQFTISPDEDRFGLHGMCVGCFSVSEYC